MIWKKSPVEIVHAKESLQGTDILRRRQLKQWINMTAEWNNSCGCNLVTEIINLWESKTAFVEVDDQAILHQEFQYNSEMFEVKASFTTRHENVVQVDEDER